MEKNKFILQIGTTVFILGLSVFLLVHSYLNPFTQQFDGLTPYSFPRAVLYLIAVLSIFELIATVVKFTRERKLCAARNEQMEKGEPVLPVRALVAMVSAVVYFFLWEYIGFTLSTLLMILFTSKYIRPTASWKSCILVAVGATAVVDILFMGLFSTPLPDPLLDWIRYGL